MTEERVLHMPDGQMDAAAGNQNGNDDRPSLGGRSDDELTAALEAILFTMGDAVEIASLARALDVQESRVLDIAARLEKKYDSPASGLMIRHFDSALQMSTRPEQYESLIRIAKVPRKLTLSDAVIETLSIVAYRQPVTKAEIEDIRGVSCEYAVNRLLEYDLICELGRKDAPGRPILFGTTEQFLRSFGLESLSELPGVEPAEEEQLRGEAEAEVDSRLGI